MTSNAAVWAAMRMRASSMTTRALGEERMSALASENQRPARRATVGESSTASTCSTPRASMLAEAVMPVARPR